jgi:TRAP-type C4-dicarboxylate transport system permease small subunit
MLGEFKKTLSLLRLFEESVMILALSLIVVLVTVQVFARYVLNSGILWSDELVGFLLVVVSMIGSAIAYREKMHTSLDFFFNKSRGAVRVALRILIEASSVLFMCALIYSGGRLALGSMNQKAFTIDIPIGIVYFVVPLGAVLILLEVVLWNISDLAGTKMRKAA